MLRSTTTRFTAFGILGAATLAVPTTLFAASWNDDFGDSGIAFGVAAFVWITGLLAVMVLPACWWAFGDERVSVIAVLSMLVALIAAHAVAFVGVEFIGSNVFFLAYPVIP